MKKRDASILPPNFYNVRPAYAVSAADKILKLKAENKTWECIETVVDVWAKTKPKEYQSYVVDITNTRETMKDPKFGTTKTRGSNLRRYLDIPETVMYILRKVYSPQELPMNKEFFRAWAKRFPKMMVVSKI